MSDKEDIPEKTDPASFVIGMFGMVPRKGREPKFNLGAYDDYILRETGLQRQIYKNDKVIEALNDAPGYLTKKNEAIKSIASQLNKSYDEEVNRYFEAGYPVEMAKEKAKHFLQQEKNRLMAIIEKEYPSSIENLAKQKLLKEKGTKLVTK